MNSASHHNSAPELSPSVIIQGVKTSQDGADMGRLLGMLLDHKWLLLLVIVLCGLGGLVYSILQTPIYQGDSLVQVERRSSINPVGESAGVGMMAQGVDYAGGMATEIQILRSRMVLGSVVDKLGLDRSVEPRRLPVIGGYIQRNNIVRPDLAGLPLLGRWMEPGNLGQGLDEWLSQHPTVWGQERIKVDRFEVEGVSGKMPLTVKVLADGRYQLLRDDDVLGTGLPGVDEHFMERKILLKLGDIEAHPGAEFDLLKLPREQAITQLTERLGISEEGANARGVSTGMLRLTLTGSDRDEIREVLDAIGQAFLRQNVERQSAEVQQSLEFLERQAPELQAQLTAAENRMSQYRTDANSIDLDSKAQSLIDQFISIESQLNELAIQEAELSQRFTVSHPTYQGLLEKKRYLNAQLARLDQQVSALPKSQQEVIRLNRDVDVAQAIYVNVLNKTQELQLVRAGTIGNMRIIDSAVVGLKPVKPQSTVIIGIAALLGGVLAMIYVLLRGVFSRGVESPEQLESLGIPVYATVPLSAEQARLGKCQGRIGKRAEKSVEKCAERSAGGKRARLLAQQFLADAAVESLRGLRTSLHFAMLDAPNNCLMICGPSPGVGKSFVALNLGAVCVQGGQRVLVIDGDLRKGGLHRAFGQRSREGLSDVLSGRLSPDEAIRDTSIEGLSYLSRGTPPPNPAELLMTQRFSDLVDKMKDRFDLVILDTPPVLAVTDAAIIGKRAGTTLMVARFMLNPPRELKLAMQRLESAGVEVKGCIINGMQRRAAATYSYGYYQYQYAPSHSHEHA